MLPPDLTPGELAALSGAQPDTSTLDRLFARGWVRRQHHVTAHGGAWRWSVEGEAARAALEAA